MSVALLPKSAHRSVECLWKFLSLWMAGYMHFKWISISYFLSATKAYEKCKLEAEPVWDRSDYTLGVVLWISVFSMDHVLCMKAVKLK